MYQHLFSRLPHDKIPRMKKKKAGRPRVENGHSARLPGVRITKDQQRAYREAAEAAGVGFGEWVRRVLDKAARKP